MKLKNLIQTNSWLSVKMILLELYADEDINISGYENIYEYLQFMDLEHSDLSIVVSHVKDEFDGEEYVDVSGKYEHPKNDEEKYSYALEFTPWNQWLGMDICKESVKQFSELEIIAHCLYEMTYIDFDEEEIQKQINELNIDVEAYKNMTDEEKKANTISLEDLLKDLEEGNNDED